MAIHGIIDGSWAIEESVLEHSDLIVDIKDFSFDIGCVLLNVLSGNGTLAARGTLPLSFTEN